MVWRSVLAVLAIVGVAAAPVHGAPLSVYGALPGIEHVTISPTGDRIALVGVVNDARSLVVLDRGNAPLMLSQLGDFKVRGLHFADDNHVLVTLSDTQKLGADFTTELLETYQVVVVDVATKKTLFVFKNKESSFGGVFGSYGTARVDDRLTGFFSTISLKRSRMTTDQNFEDGFPDLFRVDLLTGGITLLDNATSEPHEWLVDARGRVVVSLATNIDTGNWRLQNLIDRRDLAKGVDRQGRVGLVSLGQTSDTVVLSTSAGEASERWSEIDLKTGASTELLPNLAVTRVITDPATRLMIGYEVDSDNPDTRFFDKALAARMRGTVKAFPGQRVTFIAADAKFDNLIVLTEGPTDAGTWWRVDIPTGSAKDIGRSYPAIAENDFGAIQMVDYTAADGLAMHGVLTLPPGRAAKGLPLIVLPHGGPASRDYPQFDWWAQAMASRGYAVFQPNFRGSTGYGDAFQAAGHGQWGAKMQTDISDGVAALAAKGMIDPKRVCIVGASYGGYAALAGVTLQQGLYRCAVSVAGVSDLPLLFSQQISDQSDKTAIRAWEADIGPQANLDAISPANAAAKADAPILLVHGRDDTVVPYKQSERMLAALNAAHKPVELVTLTGEDHYLSRGPTRTAMLNAVVAFVEKYNPPGGH